MTVVVMKQQKKKQKITYRQRQESNKLWSEII